VKGWKSVLAAEQVTPFFHQLEHNLNAVAEARGELALSIPMAYIEARKRRA
jgi:hypothetical protein